MLSEALAIYGRRFVPLVLTCALSLVPANIVMAGSLVFGLASMGFGGVGEARTHSQQIAEQQRKLEEKPPATPEERDLRVQQLQREAAEGGTQFNSDFLRSVLQLLYAAFIAVAILLAGIALAHAAVVPLVLGGAEGPASAWAAVAARLRELGRTALIGVPLVALASLFLLVPGIAVACGFGFAIPVAMSERLAGKAALQRSWELMKGHWLPTLGIWALIATFTIAASAASALAPPGPWRAVISGAVRLLTYPYALILLVLLYQRAVSTSGGAPRPDSSAPGSAGT